MAEKGNPGDAEIPFSDTNNTDQIDLVNTGAGTIRKRGCLVYNDERTRLPRLVNDDNDDDNDSIIGNNRDISFLNNTNINNTNDPQDILRAIELNKVLDDYNNDNINGHDDDDDLLPRHRTKLTYDQQSNLKSSIWEDHDPNMEVMLGGHNNNNTSIIPLMTNIDDDTTIITNINDDNDEYDDEFLSLLQSFAKLDLPTYFSEEEACPMCNIKLPIEQFAPHVYQCIKSLDDVEKKQLEDLDYMYALALCAEETNDYDMYTTLAHSRHLPSITNNNNDMDEDNNTNNTIRTARGKYEATQVDRFIANQALVYNEYKYYRHNKNKNNMTLNDISISGTNNNNNMDNDTGSDSDTSSIATRTSTIPSASNIQSHIIQPPVTGECCICGIVLPLYQLDPHVVGCLLTPSHQRLGAGGSSSKQQQQQQQGSSSMVTTAPSAPATTATATTATATAATSTAPTAFRDVSSLDNDDIDSTQPNINATLAIDTSLPCDNDDDDTTNTADIDPILLAATQRQRNDDDTINNILSTSSPLKSSLSLSSSTSSQQQQQQQNGQLGRSNALSAGQIGLLARMVFDYKNPSTGSLTSTSTTASGGSGSVSDNTDTSISLNNLLQTFKTFGLNKSSMKKAHQDMTNVNNNNNNNNDNNNGSSGSSSSSSI